MGCGPSRKKSGGDTITKPADLAGDGLIQRTAEVTNKEEGNNKAAPTNSDGKEASSTGSKMLQEMKGTLMTKRRRQGLLQNMVHEEYTKAIADAYDLKSGKMLGKGGFGTVKIVTHKVTGEQYALKTVELSRVKDKENFDFLMKEVDIMKQLDHPNIVHLVEVYQTPDFLFMVMELCTGGNLLESYRFESEEDTAKIVGKLVYSIRYCHEHGIGHRDLKLDNILLSHAGKDADIKLVDFGLSAFYEEYKVEHDIVGTWVYMAPEVIQGSHLPDACDMWSIGVIAYLLLCGYPPFIADTLEKLKWEIKHGKYYFHQKQWGKISPLAKNFIKRLLVRNPQERMSAAEAQRHPWLNAVQAQSRASLDPQVIDNILKFTKTQTLKKVAMEVIARTMDSEELARLHAEFKKADVDGSGEITLEEFKALIQHAAKKRRINTSPEVLEKLFDEVDVDRSGKIYLNDFIAASLNVRALDDARLRLVFDRLDYSDSGFITVEDLQTTSGSSMDLKDLRQAIAECDTNGDGQVSFEEFCTAMRRHEDFSSIFQLASLTSSANRMSMTQEDLIMEVQHNMAPSAFGTEDDDDEEGLDVDSGLSALRRATLTKAASGLMSLLQRRGTISPTTAWRLENVNSGHALPAKSLSVNAMSGISTGVPASVFADPMSTGGVGVHDVEFANDSSAWRSHSMRRSHSSRTSYI